MKEVLHYDFLEIIQSTFSSIIQYIDDNYADFLIDIEEQDGVLRIDLVEQKKVFVINRNVYFKELWYSSPLSGPYHFRYDYSSKMWVTKNFEFFTLIYSEIDYILNVNQ